MAENTQTQQQSTRLPYPAEILKLPMFHANITTREEAEKYLEQNQQGAGSFFIRPNGANDPQYVSTTISTPDGHPSHAKIHITNSNGKVKYYIAENLRFGTFVELLEHYKKHRILCKERIENIRLLKPLTQKSFSNRRIELIMQCRPPAPLPRRESDVDMEIYYSFIDTVPVSFLEIYEHLKAAEESNNNLRDEDLVVRNGVCACGLKFKDSKLPDGYSIHYNQHDALRNRIFFKDKGGDVSWDLPAGLVPHLTPYQVNFILYLCKATQCPVPENLRKHLDKRLNKAKKTPAPPPKIEVENQPCSVNVGSHNLSPQAPIVIESLPGAPARTRDVRTLPLEKPLRSDKTFENQGEVLLKVRAQLAAREKDNTNTEDTMDRPVSFGSTLTTTIQSKAGSPVRSNGLGFDFAKHK